jgi:hypothetical protein
VKNIKSALKVEYFAGDCLKVVGEMCHQLSDLNKFQNAEIVAMISAEIKLKGLPAVKTALKRPTPSKAFLQTYHSGNDLTLSSVRLESNAYNRLTVIYMMSRQLALYDGMKPHHVIALIKSYLDEHILEVDV